MQTENDAGRVAVRFSPFRKPGGERWVVVKKRACPDNNGVDAAAKVMNDGAGRFVGNPL